MLKNNFKNVTNNTKEVEYLDKVLYEKLYNKYKDINYNEDDLNHHIELEFGKYAYFKCIEKNNIYHTIELIKPSKISLHTYNIKYYIESSHDNDYNDDNCFIVSEDNFKKIYLSNSIFKIDNVEYENFTKQKKMFDVNLKINKTLNELMANPDVDVEYYIKSIRKTLINIKQKNYMDKKYHDKNIKKLWWSYINRYFYEMKRGKNHISAIDAVVFRYNIDKAELVSNLATINGFKNTLKNI